MTPSAPARPLSRRARRLAGDERIAELVIRGDHEAFSLIYERYSEPIYRYCLAILRDPDDARDALQTTMLNAFRSLKDRSEGLAVRPWLYRIAHNTAASLARQRRMHSELPEHLSSEQLLPIDDFLQRERVEQVLAHLSRLPERRRGALVMRELLGLPYEEIAIALDGTPGAARQAVLEARVALGEAQRDGDVDCAEVCKRISLRDGRRLRSRAVRLHLSACESCRRFRRLIHTRRRTLGTLPPLSGVAKLGILDGILNSGAGEAVKSLAATGAQGGGLSVSVVIKGAAASIAVLSLGAGSVAIDRFDPATPPLPGGAPVDVGSGTPAEVGSAVAAPEVPEPAAEPAGGRSAPARAEPRRLVSLRRDVPSRPSGGSGKASTEGIPAGEGSAESVETGGGPDSPGVKTPPPANDSPNAAAAENPEPPSSSEQPADTNGTPPGQGGTPPGQSGTQGQATPPGQGATPPGQGGTPPGQTGASTGQSENAPGETAPPPQQGSTSADPTGAPPGQGGTPPGQGGTPPGQAEQQSAGGSDGASGLPPGQGGTPPGRGGTPTGQAKK